MSERLICYATDWRVPVLAAAPLEELHKELLTQQGIEEEMAVATIKVDGSAVDYTSQQVDAIKHEADAIKEVLETSRKETVDSMRTVRIVITFWSVALTLTFIALTQMDKILAFLSKVPPSK
ncbi:hypothetical protein COCOBI_16-4400 [Coccomyxa sp. Obi]|nr:hypothetical protein COCOBI_16-4400 [Coccomyxa sp. Obi]